MAGLVPAISLRKARCLPDRDHRHKAGDDIECEAFFFPSPDPTRGEGRNKKRKQKQKTKRPPDVGGLSI
jgi:hypothetical protein